MRVSKGWHNLHLCINTYFKVFLCFSVIILTEESSPLLSHWGTANVAPGHLVKELSSSEQKRALTRLLTQGPFCSLAKQCCQRFKATLTNIACKSSSLFIHILGNRMLYFTSRLFSCQPGYSQHFSSSLARGCSSWTSIDFRRAVAHINICMNYFCLLSAQMAHKTCLYTRLLFVFFFLLKG